MISVKDKTVISLSHVEKKYNLYAKPSDRLKEAFGVGRKVRHSEHRALKDISMEVRSGETVGIIGTNGSGKSTLLKIITGVITPSAGTVNVEGRISALLELGAGFNMEYNGIENIYLNGTMLGFSQEEIDARLQDILDFADIGEYVYQPVKTYSSGMFVRLAFAVSINIEPEILIVDEALSVGDVFFQAKCYHKFQEFKDRGKTILFVSHDLSSIAKYCDRVMLLNNGVLLGDGPPKKMIDIYKQVLVGQYRGQEDALRHMDGHIPPGDDGEKDESGDETSTARDRDDINPNLLEYGDGSARILRYEILDKEETHTSAVLKGEEFSIRMQVKFDRKIPAPIFAFTIKNKQGTEITGTNTMVEKAFLQPVEAGETKEIRFRQRLTLQGGEYLISFGVTGFEEDEFKVYHRLYDALALSCVSDKNTVGYYDMDSVVTVENVSCKQ